jgi:hypothetical protein
VTGAQECGIGGIGRAARELVASVERICPCAHAYLCVTLYNVVVHVRRRRAQQQWEESVCCWQREDNLITAVGQPGVPQGAHVLWVWGHRHLLYVSCTDSKETRSSLFATQQSGQGTNHGYFDI